MTSNSTDSLSDSIPLPGNLLSEHQKNTDIQPQTHDMPSNNYPLPDVSHHFNNNDSGHFPTLFSIERVYTVLLHVNPIQDADYVIEKLQRISPTLFIFNDKDECVDFFTDFNDVKIFLVLTEFTNLEFILLINNIKQLQSIYIFNTKMINNNYAIGSANKKVNGVYHQIEQVCYALRHDIQRLSTFSDSVYFLPNDSNANANKLESSFMYTQLFKEIFLNLEYDKDKAKRYFIEFCRDPSSGNNFTREEMDNFEKEYQPSRNALYCYTKYSFLFQNINWALRTQNMEILVRMGFFLQDLHQNIKAKHSKDLYPSKFVVYRGQGLSESDFEKMKNSLGGLIGFNCFLSTSRQVLTADGFAMAAENEQNPISIVFEIEIDLSNVTTPFAYLGNDISAYPEEEILFSMHAVFRIRTMKKRMERLWEVKLVTTNDNDPDLARYTEHIRRKLCVDNGWIKLVLLAQEMGKFQQANTILDILPEIISNSDNESIEKCMEVAAVLRGRGQFNTGTLSSIFFAKREISEVMQTYYPHDDFFQAKIHNELGIASLVMRDLPAALSYFQKALSILEKQSSRDYGKLLDYYTYLCTIQAFLGQIEEAKVNFEKGLEVGHQLLGANEPDIAESYGNVGLLYNTMGMFSESLAYYEKALEVFVKTVPTEHPHIATVRMLIGSIHYQMGNHQLALEQYDFALHVVEHTEFNCYQLLIQIKCLQGNAHLAQKNVEKALQCYKQALQDIEVNCPQNHSLLSAVKNNIALVYMEQGNYDEAMSNLQDVLKIQSNSNMLDIRTLGNTHGTIGGVHLGKGEFSNALTHFQTTLEMFQKCFRADHINIGLIYASIAVIHQCMSNYSEASYYYQKALEIYEKSSSPDSPEVIAIRSNMSHLQIMTQDFRSMLQNLMQYVNSLQNNLSLNKSDSKKYNNTKILLDQYSKQILGVCSSLQKPDLVTMGDPETVHVSKQCENLSTEQRTEVCEQLEEVVETELKVYSSDESLLVLPEKQRMAMNSAADALKQINAAKMKRQSLEIGQDQYLFDVTNAWIQYAEGMQNMLPLNNLSGVDYCNYLGAMLCSKGQYNWALKLFAKSRDLLLQWTSINHTVLAKTYDYMRTALEALGQQSEAFESAIEAVYSATIALGPGHPQTKIYEEEVQRLCGFS